MHTHKWKETYTTLAYRYDMLRFECIECKEVMLIEEIERRLNAVEMLSIQQAKDIADDLRRWDAPIDHKLQEPGVHLMLAYARILEGETT